MRKGYSRKWLRYCFDIEKQMRVRDDTEDEGIEIENSILGVLISPSDILMSIDSIFTFLRAIGS